MKKFNTMHIIFEISKITILYFNDDLCHFISMVVENRAFSYDLS